MTDQRPLILFDGDCGLCQRSEALIKRLDKHDRLRTDALGSRAALDAGIEDIPDPTGGSIIVIDSGETLRESDAVLRIGRRLGGLWKALASVARVVPKGLRDAVYRLIARNRRRFFAPKNSSCSIHGIRPGSGDRTGASPPGSPESPDQPTARSDAS